MKSVGFGDDATNESGFSGLPGGHMYHSSGQWTSQINAFFWTSTDGVPDGDGILHGTSRALLEDDIMLEQFNDRYNFGFSVRCIKD